MYLFSKLYVQSKVKLGDKDISFNIFSFCKFIQVHLSKQETILCKICKDSTFWISTVRIMSQKTKIICGAGVLVAILIVTISVVVISTSNNSPTNAQSHDQANKQTFSKDGPQVHCDKFDLKKISNMTKTPKIIIIGKKNSEISYKLYLNALSYCLEICSLVLKKRKEKKLYKFVQ